MSQSSERQARIAELARRIRRCEYRAAPARPTDVLSTGLRELDAVFPAEGLRPGTIVEWIGDSCGGGCWALVFSLLRNVLEQFPPEPPLFVVDPRGELYPPAIAALGIPLERLILLRPERQQEAVWALEQALRCPGLVAVVAPLEVRDERVVRRLQLAAEAGGALGLFLRGPEACRQTSWAEVRFGVRPLPAISNRERRLRLEVLHVRGGFCGHTLELELDDETGALRLAAELAGAASVERAS